MIFLFPYIGITALVIGLGLAVYGWRGRRIDEMPLCRACGFELRGTWPEISKCPECGADLTKAARAVRLGHRRKRLIPLSTGVILIAFFCMWEGFYLSKWAQSANWQSYSSVSSLIRDAESNDYVKSTKALAELAARIRRGELGGDETAKLVAEALDRQGLDRDDASVAEGANAGGGWDGGWGAIVEAGWARGLVSEGDALRYENQLSSFDIEVQADVLYAGALGEVRFKTQQLRIAADTSYYLKTLVSEVRIDGRAIPLGEQDGVVTDFVFAGRPTSIGRIPLPLDPGEHEIQVELSIQLADDLSPELNMPILRMARACTIQVIDRPVGAIQFVCDEATRDLVIDSLKIRLVGVRDFPKTQTNPAGKMVFGSVGLDHPPLWIPFQFILDYGDGRGLPSGGGNSVGQPGSSTTNFFTSLPGKEECATVRIHFKPKARIEEYIRVYRMTGKVWYGSFILEDVPIERWFDTADDPEFPFRWGVDSMLPEKGENP